MTETKQETKKVEEKALPEETEAHFATAKSLNLKISTKQSYEVANFIRGKKLSRAKKMLQDVIEKKIAVPFKRYNRDTGHKKGRIASGRYPEKASGAFLTLLNTVEANADSKGLDNARLFISELRSTQGSQQWHAGRMHRRRMKHTHLYIKVEESEK